MSVGDKFSDYPCKYLEVGNNETRRGGEDRV
jgi:hypothetical protein